MTGYANVTKRNNGSSYLMIEKLDLILPKNLDKSIYPLVLQSIQELKRTTCSYFNTLELNQQELYLIE